MDVDVLWTSFVIPSVSIGVTVPRLLEAGAKSNILVVPPMVLGFGVEITTQNEIPLVSFNGLVKAPKPCPLVGRMSIGKNNSKGGVVVSSDSTFEKKGKSDFFSGRSWSLLSSIPVVPPLMFIANSLCQSFVQSFSNFSPSLCIQ